MSCPICGLSGDKCMCNIPPKELDGKSSVGFSINLLNLFKHLNEKDKEEDAD